ncbi:putative DNA-binding protein [Cohnella sp. SGD-V74]|uniref:RNA-binding domain-containing protein n=1 Tax=unclassified Cohnella TaxID=2636738 RepID=UPI000D4B86ED|nr:MULTISPECIES: RNA-binding domain-containing protein [unclassified Cohnella]PRX71447.1 putative DNA-binding protein [Cohnella sp. SGD-V74]
MGGITLKSQEEVWDLIQNNYESDSLVYKKMPYDDEENLFIDVLAMVNSPYLGAKYIAVGIEEKSPVEKDILGISPDQEQICSSYKQMIEQYITPHVDIEYSKVQYNDKLIAVLKILNNANALYTMRSAYKRLNSNSLFVRKGTVNIRVSFTEIQELLQLKQENVSSSQTVTPIFEKVQLKVNVWKEEIGEILARTLIRHSDIDESVYLSTFINSKQISIMETSEKEPIFVLLGDAGDGKSTFLKQIYIDTFENGLKIIPFYVSLNTYAGEDIKVFVEKGNTYLPEIQAENFLFLFDEFDQVTNKDQLSRKLLQFMAHYKGAKFCIASRSNNYSHNFSNATLLQLSPLRARDIEKYAEKKLGNRSKLFLANIVERHYMDFVKNPFNLKHLINYFISNSQLPESRSLIIEDVIRGSITTELSRCEADLSYRGTYNIDGIYRHLQKLSLVMELLQQNYISSSLLQQIIPNKEERYLIKQLSIIRKNFLKSEENFQFIHNNYNEHLCADVLKNIELSKLVTLFSIDELEEENINPSWANVIAFLHNLRLSPDLNDYLLGKRQILPTFAG